MHFEILVEDQSGKRALDILMPKIIGDKDAHTFKIHAYRGIGRIPKDLHTRSDARHRILLEQLPKLLRGYGNTFVHYPDSCPASVIVVCDLDDKCLSKFRQELLAILNDCHPKPKTRFCIAIEEGEAWFLGDISAIKAAYPRADDAVLNDYQNDSICGTWECLADAVYPGGSRRLSAIGGKTVGAEKSAWSEKISPHMDVKRNLSPSFNYFKQKILELTGVR